MTLVVFTGEAVRKLTHKRRERWRERESVGIEDRGSVGIEERGRIRKKGKRNSQCAPEPQ